jgi:ABC-type nickel/cobalt efflux system permease component RcnA
MGKTTKKLLILSLACLVMGLGFVTGVINVKELVGLYVALPLGAVFFGLFLIFRMLEKETSLYDDEHEMQLSAAKTPMEKQVRECDCGHSHAHAASPIAH